MATTNSETISQADGCDMKSDSKGAACLTEKLGDAACSITNKVDEVASRFGQQVTDFAKSVKERVPTEGKLGAAAGTVVNTLETSGDYLSSNGVKDVAEDFTDLIKRYPVRALGVGLGIGVLLGRSLFSRR